MTIVEQGRPYAPYTFRCRCHHCGCVFNLNEKSEELESRLVVNVWGALRVYWTDCPNCHRLVNNIFPFVPKDEETAK